MSISANDSPPILHENGDSTDDSEDDEPVPEYYQPISAVDDDDEDEDEDGRSSGGNESNGNNLFNPNSNFENHNNNCHAPLSNGGGDLNKDKDETTTEAEEEERIRAEAASESAAISRAFREDESRRNAPLPPENATRIMDAMREISFGPSFTPPGWAHQVSEDRWIDQLTRLRLQSQSQSQSQP